MLEGEIPMQQTANSNVYATMFCSLLPGANTDDIQFSPGTMNDTYGREVLFCVSESQTELYSKTN